MCRSRTHSLSSSKSSSHGCVLFSIAVANMVWL